jgi:hypothetical protein
MKSHRGNIIPATLAASAILGMIASVSLVWFKDTQQAAVGNFSLTPSAAVVNTDNTVTFDLVVTADTSVNAFGGTLIFDESILAVEKIDYNTSIADLWAKAPWYEKGSGTISFGGGTTKPGGFVGQGTLLTITFMARTPGKAAVSVQDIQILEHDGYGTPLTTDTEIDSILTIVPHTPSHEEKSIVIVRSENVSSDLNNDGTVSLKDASILFGYLTSGDLRGDLNGDGRVSLGDMSTLMSNF